MAEGNRILDDAASKAAANVSPLEGSGLAQDANELVNQALRFDWTEGLVSLGSAALDVADVLKDPMAKLISMGLGWVIEFFGPLNWILDKLVGDQEQIDRLSLTWEGISSELGGVAEDLDTEYRSATADWSGHGVAQYMRYCGESVELYKAASGAAAATAGLIKISGVILKVVRTIVRQLITDCVGKAISIVLRYPPPATPAAAPEVVNTITETGTMVGNWLKKLQRAFSNAEKMLKDSKNLFADLRKYMRVVRDMSTATSSLRVGLAAKLIGGEALDLGKAAGAAAGDALAAGAAAIPKNVVIEGTKESAKQVAADIDPEPAVPETNQAAGLYEGPGPHRVSGTLEEPS